MSRRFRCDLPFGAQVLHQDQTRFRLWAPGVEQVWVDLMEGEQLAQSFPMKESGGFFSCTAPVPAGSTYFYRLPNGMRVPDPASRQQGDDVHGPSLVVNPEQYEWANGNWLGRPWREMVIYEIHPGCWGGFRGIEQGLDYLRELGITAIELMPVADFPGQRNWGYDGVLPFAPDRSYGSPHDLKQLIDTAHGLGLCVYLDVVYNHFGPDGNYLHSYAPQFFNEDASSPWGAEIDFRQRPVRDFFTENAWYWLSEYRFDGLRFDAVHAISDPSWLDEMAATLRHRTEANRQVHLVLENERNRSSHLERHFDAQWNDDGHNVLHLLLTGEHEGYYANYVEQPVHKLARMLESGFVYQGEPSPVHGNKPRGSPSEHLPLYRFVLFLQNHDQVGNRAFGERLTTLCDSGPLKAAITLQLLNPQIPLLFMDEERGSTTPFLYFTDFHGELAAAVRDGRRHEFRAFSAFADERVQETIPDPNAEETFVRSTGFAAEDSPQQRKHYQFYHRLLELRRRVIIPDLESTISLGTELAGSGAVIARWQLRKGRTLWMFTNLSAEDELGTPAPGDLLFESRKGAAQAAQGGRLLHWSTSVFIEET